MTFEIGIDLQKKDASVNLQLVPEFKLAAPILKTAWIMHGAECVVTSGRDGVHSKQTAHDDGRAIDCRSFNLARSNWVPFGTRLAKALVTNLGPYWYVVLEKDHYHIEFANGIPNIIGWKAGQHFYAQKGL